MTSALDATPYLRQPPRTLPTLLCDTRRQLANKRAELRIVLDRNIADGIDTFCPRMRSLYREIAALRRRANILSDEIGRRAR